MTRIDSFVSFPCFKITCSTLLIIATWISALKLKTQSSEIFVAAQGTAKETVYFSASWFICKRMICKKMNMQQSWNAANKSNT